MRHRPRTGCTVRRRGGAEEDTTTVPPVATRDALERDLAGIRIGWSPDLGGLPVEPEVLAVLETGRAVLEDLGCVTDESAPDLDGAHEVFTTWRAWYFDLAFGPILDRQPGVLKDTVVWNIEAGRALRGPQLAETERRRAALHRRLRAWFAEHDFLATTVAQVAPFDVDQPYVTEIAGQTLPTYLDWMKSCYLVSATGLPAISVPCGFTPAGLPVGLQIVGRPYDDLGVLQLAHAFEQATDCRSRRPQVLSTV